ncbi:hypothetical protein V8E51_016716 [Hyaloscypha variabilis]
MPLPSLDVFIANFLYSFYFSNSYPVINLAYEKYVSPSFQANINGVTTNYNTTLPIFISQNATLKDLFLGYQDFVISPVDPTNNTGEVAYTVSFPVIDAGTVSAATLGAIYKINITDQGLRQVTSMFGVLNIVLAGPPAPPMPAELSLEAFIADIIYQSAYSPNVTECENEVQLTPAGFHDFVVTTRQEISNRRLLNQSCITNAGDEQENTGQVVHTARDEGIREGVPVTFTVVSITEVNLVEDVSGSHRQIIL